jgi:hypothetical protein
MSGYPYIQTGVHNPGTHSDSSSKNGSPSCLTVGVPCLLASSLVFLLTITIGLMIFYLSSVTWVQESTANTWTNHLTTTYSGTIPEVLQEGLILGTASDATRPKGRAIRGTVTQRGSGGSYELNVNIHTATPYQVTEAVLCYDGPAVVNPNLAILDCTAPAPIGGGLSVIAQSIPDESSCHIIGALVDGVGRVGDRPGCTRSLTGVASAQQVADIAILHADKPGCFYIQTTEKERDTPAIRKYETRLSPIFNRVKQCA